MATFTQTSDVIATDRPQRSIGSRFLSWFGRYGVVIYLILAFIYLFLPVFLVILFSFNNIQARFNFTWKGFTLKWWRNVFTADVFGGVPGLFDSLVASLQIAFISAAVATVLGTLIALALVRYRFRGRGSTNVLIFLPMATPEVVLGSAMLALFILLKIPTGFGTITIAHILFSISFCVLIVRARLQGYDRHLEEAAMDLYANEWQTFYRVTLRMIMPGVFAAFLLAFALSFDDFIITNFNSGQTVTFPLYIWGAARVGVPPQVNVLGTLIFVVTVGLMLIGILASRRRA